MAALASGLPSQTLRKWKTGPGYRQRFCEAFSSIGATFNPIVSALSFQEKTLRAAQAALDHAYNSKIGGPEGRGIHFGTTVDAKGRRQMTMEFVNFHGYHKVQAPDNQMMVLLLMTWFIADQYTSFYKNIVLSGTYGFGGLDVTVVSDKLSGDDDFREVNAENLRNLIDPDGRGGPIRLTRSRKSDEFSGDLLADNLAGWLNAAITDPKGEAAQLAVALGEWPGWHVLLPSTAKLEGVPAIRYLRDRFAARS